MWELPSGKEEITTPALKEGTPTHRFWAGNRVFIEAKPEDILRNLLERKNLSKYDPRNIEEIEKRIFDKIRTVIAFSNQNLVFLKTQKFSRK